MTKRAETSQLSSPKQNLATSLKVLSNVFPWLLGLLLYSAGIAAQSVPGYVYSSPMLPLILQMPQNAWLKVNTNFYSDVWTPSDLEPLDNGATHTPSKIILAWSGFGWDSNRGDLILYGGGHANYSGNDVYRWRTSTMQWERASLPSEIYNDPVAGFQAIDGVDSAPSSAHTYDNNLFLPIADRFLTWGGAAYNNGGPYLRVAETNPNATRAVGPYLFDPNRADGNKVGGTTGSHVMRVAPHPEIVGGQMWENRDIHLNLAAQLQPGAHVNGCTAYVNEAGRDVVYVGATNAFSTNLDLYRYQLTDIANPALDQISKVGIFWAGTGGPTTCGYDPVHKLFVRTGTNSIPFLFWDLTTPGVNNPDQRVQIDATIGSFQSWLGSQGLNIQNCALEYDPVRNAFPFWCGASTVWVLYPPASGNTVSGWTITQMSAPPPPSPPGDTGGTGVLGKWRYAPFYDVFVGLEDINEGHVWIYKPAGWVQPNPVGNTLPTVTITAPANGTTVAPGTPVNLTSSASDPGGGIARVEYYVNGVKLGQATVSPYLLSWTPMFVGNYNIVAVAVDNVGGMKASAGVSLTVNATLTTATLQRGLAGYSGVSDTFVDASAITTVYGATSPLYLDATIYTPLLRFAIFQSDGGPVPNGAVIQSASLQLYKQYYDDTLQLNSLLKPWVEAQATWLNSQSGVPWSAGGAAGAGTDYTVVADAQVAAGFNPGWVAFDVTSRVQQWSNGASTNYGWRLAQTTSGGNPKQFNSSEYAADTTLRPKLTVVYAQPPGNVPPTVAIATPSNGASIALGGSFALTATASDADGTVTLVEYFANGGKVGQATTAPYSVTWVPGATGSYVVTARATDNLGAMTTSTPITVTVTAGSGTTTIVMQRGLSGYAGSSDTFLDNYLRTTARGGTNPLYLDLTNYRPLLRFAIFQSDGGPVPNGAVIQSAKVELYKQFYNDTLQLNSLLKPWVEAQATWLNSQSGVAWSAGGAAGAGTDYTVAADAQVAAGFNPGWVTFDVTSRVQQWSNGASINYGWRLTQTTSGSNAKQFNSSEYAADTTLRPKLTVVYAPPPSTVPPTVAIATPSDGASIALGGSFALTATASDADGTVTLVEYFANGGKVGQATTAPYSVTWVPSATGSYVMTARATDNLGAMTTSTPITLTVTGSGATTVVMQRGLSGYAGSTDTFLDNYLRTTARGSMNPLYLDLTNYRPLLRFAIFQSDGGPVPNGAVIQSAKLELYKQFYNDTLQVNSLLRPWVEAQATWLNSQSGVPWSAGGAAGAGTDYTVAADAQVAAGFNPGWVTFDVTSRVQQWSNGAGANYGWRLTQTTSGSNAKQFNSSEYAADTTLRPKLTVVFQ